MTLQLQVDMKNLLYQLTKEPPTTHKSCDCIFLEIVTEEGNLLSLRFENVRLLHKFARDIAEVTGANKVHE